MAAFVPGDLLFACCLFVGPSIIRAAYPYEGLRAIGEVLPELASKSLSSLREAREKEVIEVKCLMSSLEMLC